MFYILSTRSNIKLLENVEELMSIIGSNFYRYYSQYKILMGEFKYRYRKHRDAAVSVKDPMNEGPVSHHDVPNIHLIQIPNTLHTKTSLFSAIPKKAIIRMRSRQYLDPQSQDFDSLPLVRHYISSNKFLEARNPLAPAMHAPTGLSKCEHLVTKERAFSASRKAFEMKQDFGCSLMRKSSIKKAKHLYVASDFDEPDIHLSDEDPDVENTYMLKAQMTIATQQQKVIELDTQDSYRDQLGTINEHLGCDIGHEKIRETLQGIKPRGMRKLTLAQPSLVSVQPVASDAILAENAKIRLPMANKAKTMKVLQGNSLMTQIDVLPPCFGQAERKLLSSLALKKGLSATLTDFHAQRMTVYRSVVTEQLKFPVERILKAIEDLCKEILEHDLMGYCFEKRFFTLLGRVSMLQQSLMANLDRLLGNFLSLDEFKMLSAALDKDPKPFLGYSTVLKPQGCVNSNSLLSFNLDTYKVASDSLIIVLEAIFSHFNHIVDMCQSSKAKPQVSKQLTIAIGPKRANSIERAQTLKPSAKPEKESIPIAGSSIGLSGIPGPFQGTQNSKNNSFIASKLLHFSHVILEIISTSEKTLCLTPFESVRFKNKFRAVKDSQQWRRLLYFELLQADFQKVEFVQQQQRSSCSPERV